MESRTVPLPPPPEHVQGVPPKVSVCIATHDMVPAMFMYDLASLVAYTVAGLPEDVPFGINMMPGTYIHTAREDLMKAVLSDGATHMLWLDSDMRFPRDALVRLLNHSKPVVGINYAQRGVPADFVAIKEVAAPGSLGEKLRTDENSAGLEQVEAIGFGMVLIRIDALKGLDPNERWFWYEDVGDGRQYGEDVYFCRKLGENDIPIYVDHDLSKECAHIGQFEYRLEHADTFSQEEAAALLEEVGG